MWMKQRGPSVQAWDDDDKGSDDSEDDMLEETGISAVVGAKYTDENVIAPKDTKAQSVK